jgi:hypothetical protein
MVHFNEPPGETDSPYMRVFVEKNVVDLDPGENGTLTTENAIEVRADSVGKLEVGPINLNVVLEDKQTIEVEFQADGTRDDGKPRTVTKFSWSSTDQDQPRYWEIFTGQPDFVPNYKYRVHVLVKGSIFSKGQEWIGPWIDTGGNGPLMVSVPMPDDPGVTKRAIKLLPLSTTAGVGTPEGGVGAPPRSDSGSVGVGAPKKKAIAGLGAPPADKTSTTGGQRATVGGYSLKKSRSTPGAGKSVPKTDGGLSGEKDSRWTLDVLPGWSSVDPSLKDSKP